MIDPETPLAELGERELLRHIRSRIPAGAGVLGGPGDDAAAVEIGPSVLVTSDSMVEGVHFRREWSPPSLLGRKALTVNLSDIAAMAGVPRYAVVSLCLPADATLAFVDGLYDGLLERAAETGVSIVGGNVSASGGGIVVDVTVLGQSGRLLTRTGARAGDLAVLTGAVGAAAAGLKLLGQGARLGADGEVHSTGMWTESSTDAVRHCLRAQLDPSPPLAFGRALAEGEVARAAIDVSDGLSVDLGELCAASGLGAVVDADALPIDGHAAAFERAQGGDALSLALHGGEDYQLLLAVGPNDFPGLEDVAVVWELRLTVVGEFVAGRPELSLRSGGRTKPLPASAWEHFRSRRPRPEPRP
jgi:thiamine-monophosphate kinase